MSPIPNEDILRAVTAYADAHGGFLHGRHRLDAWLKANGYKFTAGGVVHRFGCLKLAAAEANVLYAGNPKSRSKAKEALERFKRWLREKPDMGEQTLLWQYKDGNFDNALEAAIKRYKQKFGHDAVTVNLNVCEDADKLKIPEGLKCRSNQWIQKGYFLLGSE